MTVDPVIQLPIEAGMMLLFARAIGDEGWASSMAGQPPTGKGLAPPTFTQTLQHFIPGYAMRPQPGIPWIGSSSKATGVTQSEPGPVSLHAEQHFEYHRPVLAGMVLTSVSQPGRIWTKTGRSGLLRFSEQVIEFRGAQGDLMVTSRIVGVQVPESSAVPVGAGPGAAPIVAGPPSGDLLVHDLTRTQIVQYAGASGDFNPLHTDEIYATQVAGYPSVIAHGMLTMGMTGRALTDRFGPLALRGFGGRFRAQVLPGDSLWVQFRRPDSTSGSTSLTTVQAITVNQHGNIVLEAQAVLDLSQP